MRSPIDVDDGSAATRDSQNAPTSARRRSHLLVRLFQPLGPGLITGGADDDPTGIATYAQAGAQTGYGLLWTTVLTLPMLMTVQFIATKVALLRGQGLAGVIRDHYPRAVLYPAILGLVIANVINAGADIGAIAAAINMFVSIPIQVLILPIGLLILLFLTFGTYHLIENTFKWLTLALLAYVATAFMARPDLGAIFQGTFIPHISLSTGFLTLLVATLGGNVSPYLIFWQAELEVEKADEEARTHRPARPPVLRLKARAVSQQIKNIAWDTNIGMIFSNLIIFFIEVCSAETLFKAGHHNVDTAQQAAQALRPLLGNAATVLWAIGMVGSGFLAVPALTGSAADAVASTFAWRHGLRQKPTRAMRFYAVLMAAIVIGLGINFLGISPIRLLVISAAINGCFMPPLLVLLLLVANRKDVMGERVNGLGLNLLGLATTLIMTLAALGLLYTLL